jgi:hypothetical protein
MFGKLLNDDRRCGVVFTRNAVALNLDKPANISHSLGDGRIITFP